HARIIQSLVGSDGAPAVTQTGAPRPLWAVVSVAGDVEVLVGLRGLVDAGKERDRIERRLKKGDKDIAVLEKRLANPSFASNAPASVVAEASAQLELLRRQKQQLQHAQSLADELSP
ncbi:MAG TPA: hypothetical protein VER33_04215, partial [Polyangiaceae bacterium]|nr:hypothetical protein [Polyangiaceae bacterium]